MSIIYDIHGNILFQDDKLSLIELVEKNKFDLSGANLRGANLEGANLFGSNLSGASLRGSNLRGSNLRYTNLIGSNLEGANLEGSNLRYTNLEGSNLRCANLRGADLINTNLSGSNLRGSNLSGANLIGSNLEGANLEGATIPIFSKWGISYRLNSKNFEASDINKILIIIGCKEKTIQEWDNWFNSDEEFETKRGTNQFKQIYANYVAVREFLKIMVKGEN